MPTYEYVCERCKSEWEEEQSIKAPPTRKCSTCGEEAAKRQVSRGAGFVLKGGGWYADGYSKSST